MKTMDERIADAKDWISTAQSDVEKRAAIANARYVVAVCPGGDAVRELANLIKGTNA